MEEVRLKNIFIGDPDGLAEARKDKFNEFFYKKNKKYEELYNNCNKFIVTGRKGTGKTLLAKYYEMQMKIEGGTAKYIDKDQVLFRQLQAIGNGDIPQRERAVFILYAILREVSGLLIAQEKANKYVVNSQVNLNWLKDGNTGNPSQHMLMDMIFNKVRTSVDEWKERTNEELFECLFPPKIKGRETLKFLLNFSHGRPRDIVNMLNKIISKYPEEQAFTNEMFIAVEQEYSRDFCNELRNEMSLYYGSEYINACFSMLTLIRKRNFWKAEAEKVIAKNTQLAVIVDLDKALEILYQYGAIGNMKVLNKSDYKFYFGYREDGSETLNYAEKFTVHFALRKELL